MIRVCNMDHNLVQSTLYAERVSHGVFAVGLMASIVVDGASVSFVPVVVLIERQFWSDPSVGAGTGPGIDCTVHMAWTGEHCISWG